MPLQKMKISTFNKTVRLLRQSCHVIFKRNDNNNNNKLRVTGDFNIKKRDHCNKNWVNIDTKSNPDMCIKHQSEW